MTREVIVTCAVTGGADTAAHDERAQLAGLLASRPPLVFAAIEETIRETMHLPVLDVSTSSTGSEKRDPVWTGT